MRTFWTQGYEGTSIQDLVQAMGVNKPSLYATFGCKEEIFREAVELYDRVEGRATSQSLADARTAREAVETMLRANARAYTVAEGPRGCMIVLSSLLGAPENARVRAFLADNRLAGEALLQDRLAQGIAQGDLAPTADKLGMIIDAATLAWPA
ncbi:TetR/AcrR family transcriptional regulator [Bordetella parapertussis]|uniref:TetR-family transcriptional regulator n=1 Tax=Bordetella parapertussis (strain Bpp5) TaxID=1208660 RepID=K0MHL7_BORPB|nr:TetR/AcrR family transcriptional regulator [Bordetella parapertussis]CCJ50998.1 putative TetR-family transcriptional regulator [Bordetella parapertussis Bpp5]